MRLRIAAALLVAFVFAPCAARAQLTEPEPPAETTVKDDRELARHRYLFPILAPETAFVTTHFGIRQGFVYGAIPALPLGTEKLDVTRSGLLETADLGVKITDWIGVFGSLSGTVLVGTNVGSLLLTGASFNASGEGGVVVRVARIERSGTQIAVRARGGGGPGREANVLGLVGALVANPGQNVQQIVDGKLGRYILTPTSNVFGALSVHAAQTLTRNFALQAQLRGDYSVSTFSPYDATTDENVDTKTTTTSGNATIAATADGSPNGFPLGAMVEYGFALGVASTGGESKTTDPEHIIGVGVYYTGSRVLQLGIGGAMQLGLKPVTGIDAAGKPADSGTPSLYYAQFILRHIW
jgi:hypothetical protein